MFRVDCHHNYCQRETHFEKAVWVTRKGAVSARLGEYGIVPGSMGARSFIVRGKGNPASFHSCAHGAGRRMSRTQARQRFAEADLVAQTRGVECRKDRAVLDEVPQAYKDIEQVMRDQEDLVEVVYQLKQVLCVKGG
jgi:tRNA-splicing ligase RtcB